MLQATSSTKMSLSVMNILHVVPVYCALLLLIAVDSSLERNITHSPRNEKNCYFFFFVKLTLYFIIVNDTKEVDVLFTITKAKLWIISIFCFLFISFLNSFSFAFHLFIFFFSFDFILRKQMRIHMWWYISEVCF